MPITYLANYKKSNQRKVTSRVQVINYLKCVHRYSDKIGS